MDATQTAYLVALTTVGSEDDAKKLVRGLVEGRHAACGTIIPSATSLYWWEGSVSEESEVVVLLKTRADRWAGLEQAVRRLHPYDVPELLALPVENGLAEYLRWLHQETEQEAGAQ